MKSTTLLHKSPVAPRPLPMPFARAGTPRRGGLITTKEIESASLRAQNTGADMWLTDPAPRGQGRFTIRCTPSGARVCMYRYATPAGKRDILRVGDYDAKGIVGLSLQAARERARELVKQAMEGDSPRTLREEKERQATLAAAKRLAVQRKA